MMPSPVLFASALDWAFGDPAFGGHPVRLMGRQIAFLDGMLNRGGRGPRLASGLAVALLVPAAWAALAWALVKAAGAYSNWAAWGVSAVLIYFCLAGRDMVAHALAVARPLGKKDLAQARLAVAGIVGRDTKNLDAGGVSRACVESVSESLSDGLLAPMIYAFLGGAPAALAYKAVSTLDSMLGYRNARYEAFGKASARLDDLANFIPARLCALLVAACALFQGRALSALRCAWNDAGKQPSPNSGWPEAAMAGALGLKLGGPASYGGKKTVKAALNAGGRRPEARDIYRSLAYFGAVAALGLLLMELAHAFV